MKKLFLNRTVKQCAGLLMLVALFSFKPSSKLSNDFDVEGRFTNAFNSVSLTCEYPTQFVVRNTGTAPLVNLVVTFRSNGGQSGGTRITGISAGARVRAMSSDVVRFDIDPFEQVTINLNIKYNHVERYVTPYFNNTYGGVSNDTNIVFDSSLHGAGTCP